MFLPEYETGLMAFAGRGEVVDASCSSCRAGVHIDAFREALRLNRCCRPRSMDGVKA